MELKHTFNLLEKIESKCHQNVLGLPIHDEVVRTWEGITLILDTHHLVLPIMDAVEVLNVPRTYAIVPGTKDWVLGVANIRGNLLPILDLKSFLFNEKTEVSNRSRILVINHAGLHAGILLDQIIGMRYFPEDREVEVKNIPKEIEPYIISDFEVDDIVWHVFDIRKLAENEHFRRASGETVN